jgi:hypothetical protein
MLEQYRQFQQFEQFRPFSCRCRCSLLKPTRPDFPKNLNSHVLHLEGGIKRVVNPQ